MVLDAILITAGALVFVALLLITIFRYVDPGIVVDDYRACRGGWHEAFLNRCEEGLLKIPQQPVNTYTNLAYLAAGLLTDLALDTAPSFVFAVTMAYLCIGSALYHGLSTGWAGMLDVTAIYTVFSAMAVYAATALAGVEGWLGGSASSFTAGVMLAVAGLAAFALSKRYRRRMNVVIGVFLGATYALVLLRMAVQRHWEPWPLLVVSLVVFALAYGAWQLDRKRVFPLKHWGHGVWHLLTAAASALLFYATHQVW